MTDPISDMLARIRNAGMARHPSLKVPSSKLKLAVARVLAEAGYIASVGVEAEGGRPVLSIKLRFGANGKPVIDGMRRVSKPSRRVYVEADAIPRVRSGLGTAVLSTNKGVLSDAAAREQRVGGELLCEVW
ncbi:MAG: 30S ribosomal protein S8 [Myxococcota bacterium]|jgi:small subunit ribosomal protein S8